MDVSILIEQLYRAEYGKLVSVLCSALGIAHMEVAEDAVSDTFVAASQKWADQGIPENPSAWLYTVSKNRARDVLRRQTHFDQRIAPALTASSPRANNLDIPWSEHLIEDSQLQMVFAICHPSIPVEAQMGLALRILGGFGIDEIAQAFWVSKDTINKRLYRAKEKLRKDQIDLAFPPPDQIETRLESVMKTLYLWFNEGYYSAHPSHTLRKDMCLEAMRLTYLLAQHELTCRPATYALLSLMCFHTSRFEARINPAGEMVLYEDQDRTLWNQELIQRGNHYLNTSATGDHLTRYHLEAAISYWHTQEDNTPDKWEHILQLYNQLLQLAYSPVAALNRTYALARARDNETALREALKLQLDKHAGYHALLGELYTLKEPLQAIAAFQEAQRLSNSLAEQRVFQRKMDRLQASD